MIKVYILHGWAYDTKKWDKLEKYLHKNQLDPVILKIPGLTAPSTDVWTIPKYVEWLHHELKPINKPIVLIGHSNGGRIAMAYAIKHPAKLSQLILIDSAGVYHNEPMLRVKKAVFSSLAKAGKTITNSEKMRLLLHKSARVQDYQKALPNMRQTMVNVTEFDKTLDITKVTSPTTIIWGSDDKLTPLSDGELIAHKITGSKLHVIHGSRHAPFYDQPPEVVGNIILETLN